MTREEVLKIIAEARAKGEGVILTGANLTGANLRGANGGRMPNLTKLQILDAMVLDHKRINGVCIQDAQEAIGVSLLTRTDELEARIEELEAQLEEAKQLVIIAESAQQDANAMLQEARGFISDLYAERGQDKRIAYLCNQALGVLRV